MAQQMITLEEAAEKLGLTTEEMKKRLKTDPEFKRLSQIRDGSTVRFKLSAIEELARELGMSSETDLPLAPMLDDDPGSDDFKVPGADDKKKGKKSDADVPLDFGDAESDVFSLADDASKAASPKSSAKLTPNKPAKNMSDSSSGTDSDVRLDGGKSKKPKSNDEATVPTEEIALDFSGPGSAVIKGGSSAKLSAPKPGGSSGKLSSPDTGKVKAPSSGDIGPGKKSDLAKKSDSMKKSDGKKSNVSKRSDAPADSSEFELSLDADSDDFELQMSSDSSAGDEVDLGSLPKDKGIARGSKSGINLRDPADSGISLEKGKGKEKDAKGSKAAKGSKGPKDSATDDSSDSGTTTAPSDVDFELSLDSSEAASTSKLGAPKSGKLVLDSESDSEFELTLDDSSSSSLEQAALGAEAAEGDDKGDIFETDFEIPPMPDESGSEAVAVDADSDLEKADFEMAPDDSDVAADEPSQSAVVLVDDDSGPRAKAKTKKASKASVAEVDLDAEDVEADDEESAAGALKGVRGKKRGDDEDEDEEAVPAGAMVERPTKPWGVLPALFLAPTLLITLVGALMGYEMLQTMWGYQQPRKPAAPITRGLADAFGMPLNDQ